MCFVPRAARRTAHSGRALASLSTERAPWISRVRRYLSHLGDAEHTNPLSGTLVPGTKPSQAANSRPDPKAEGYL